MSRLWVISDLHQELARFPWAPRRPEFDVLVVAGDVYEGDIARAIGWVADLAGGKPAVFVPGNHEFWHGTVEAVLAKGREAAAARGVTLLDGTGLVEIDGVAFAGGTLWTDQALGLPFGTHLYQADFGESTSTEAGP
jgi:predicted phosphohydrolase